MSFVCIIVGTTLLITYILPTVRRLQGELGSYFNTPPSPRTERFLSACDPSSPFLWRCFPSNLMLALTRVGAASPSIALTTASPMSGWRVKISR